MRPDLDSLWHFPAWTGPNWIGPWRVVDVGRVVVLEQVDEPPGHLHEVPLDRWPAGWEPWPVVPDFPP